MAMNFFQQESKAHERTGILLSMFILCASAVAGLSGLIIDVAYNAYIHKNPPQRAQQPPPSPVPYVDGNVIWVFLGVSGLIALAAWLKELELRRGGSAIASMLRARPVSIETKDEDERRLLNIVEEMSIASTTPPPAVFLLDNEDGINACVAGHSSKDVALIVTRGAIELLTRDELQGVIGHEYSHVFNGDMKMNMQLTCMAFGMTCIYEIGHHIADVPWRCSLHSSSDNDPKGHLIVMATGYSLMAVGAIGAGFGTLLQAAISRQRELLADASSVQYTRNPAGIAGALKKIAVHSNRGTIRETGVSQVSHFFFANTSDFDALATHPPLVERIKALDASFTGEIDYDELPWPAAKPKPEPGLQTLDSSGFNPTAVALGAAVLGPASNSESPVVMRQKQAAAQEKLMADKIPAHLQDAVREPTTAAAIIYALLLSSDEKIKAKQLTTLVGKANQFVYNELTRHLSTISSIEAQQRLPLACLSVPTLRRLSLPQYEQFKSAMTLLIDSDGKVDLFEYVLQKLVQRHLDAYFQGAKPRKLVSLNDKLAPDIVEILSAIAYLSMPEEQAHRAILEALQKLGLTKSKPSQQKEISLNHFDKAIEAINQGDFDVRMRVINAATDIVMHDEVATLQERQILMALADALEAPVPEVVWICQDEASATETAKSPQPTC